MIVTPPRGRHWPANLTNPVHVRTLLAREYGATRRGK